MESTYQRQADAEAMERHLRQQIAGLDYNMLNSDRRRIESQIFDLEDRKRRMGRAWQPWMERRLNELRGDLKEILQRQQQLRKR